MKFHDVHRFIESSRNILDEADAEVNQKMGRENLGFDETQYFYSVTLHKNDSSCCRIPFRARLNCIEKDREKVS